MNRHAFVFGVLLLIALIGIGGCNSAKRHKADIVVSKVERFRKLQGRLPDRLSEVGMAENESCPCYCKTSNNSYLVWYGTSLGESETYDSRTGKWSDVNGVCSR
jgi:hypothetical protein